MPFTTAGTRSSTRPPTLPPASASLLSGPSSRRALPLCGHFPQPARPSCQALLLDGHPPWRALPLGGPFPSASASPLRAFPAASTSLLSGPSPGRASPLAGTSLARARPPSGAVWRCQSHRRRDVPAPGRGPRSTRDVALTRPHKAASRGQAGIARQPPEHPTETGCNKEADQVTSAVGSRSLERATELGRRAVKACGSNTSDQFGRYFTKYNTDILLEILYEFNLIGAGTSGIIHTGVLIKIGGGYGSALRGRRLLFGEVARR